MGILNTNYYQLASLLPGQQGTSTNTGSAPTGSSTQSLINALASTGTSGGQVNNDSAFSLNLSPAAQLLLNGNSGDTSSSAGNNFNLTDAQQKTIEGIVQKYADAPLTQDTYNKILQDLQAAGLSPAQLSAQDMLNSFNVTSSLIEDLNGNINTSLINPNTSLANEQTKANSYMQDIVQEWQSLSTAASSGQNGQN